MRRSIVSLAIVAGLAIGGYYGFNTIQTQRGSRALLATGLVFQSLPRALEQARAERRPVLVDFSAIWCPTCRRLHETVFTDRAIQAAIAGGYVLARVDYDAPEAPAFMERYAVTGFPSLLVVDADGRLLRRLPVTFEPAVFARALREGPG